MTHKLLIAATLAFGFGTAAAMAQSTPAQPETGAAGPTVEGTLPMGWEGPIGDAFFSDSAAGTLRSEAEIRANWEGLTAEQQAQVRTDCATFDTARTQPDDKMTTGSVTTGDRTDMAAVEQVCDMVGAQ